MINERFVEYFRTNIFHHNEEEFQSFLKSLNSPIQKTIRIKPDMEAWVRSRLESDGWILEPTNIAHVFRMDRRADFDPYDRRLGFSLDHICGNFYIQELAAAHPVSILASGEIQEESFLILDMASSPGGKTTQLAEYFPNSFIIANEPTRERIPQLLQNLERMNTPNVGITLYPGQQWRQYREVFDRILLDAPCSGEGTLFKGTDAAKHWHIKNIKTIARLQEKLLDSAVHALKVDWEMIYSTCSLNLLENEGVINNILSKYPESFEILFEKKFWPHIDKTGGFFVVKLKKIQSLPEEEWQKRIPSTNTELKKYTKSLHDWIIQDDIQLYEHHGKILAVRNAKNIEPLMSSIFLMRFGEKIGTIKEWTFVPNGKIYQYIQNPPERIYTLESEEELDIYLRGYNIPHDAEDGYIQIQAKWITISMESVQKNMIMNSLSSDWLRK
jgi:16S rRNA (cytosine1407-C5)-methyltransferase